MEWRTVVSTPVHLDVAANKIRPSERLSVLVGVVVVDLILHPVLLFLRPHHLGLGRRRLRRLPSLRRRAACGLGFGLGLGLGLRLRRSVDRRCRRRDLLLLRDLVQRVLRLALLVLLDLRVGLVCRYS